MCLSLEGCHHKLHQEDKPLEENCCGGCNSEEATVRTAQKDAQEPVLLPAPVAMAPQPVPASEPCTACWVLQHLLITTLWIA